MTSLNFSESVLGNEDEFDENAEDVDDTLELLVASDSVDSLREYAVDRMITESRRQAKSKLLLGIFSTSIGLEWYTLIGDTCLPMDKLFFLNI